ncbi:Vta1 like-domain-containing protein [Mycena amicta]|nr:Vta1 like-domain-containing protein [Mycena amicta]
MTLPPTPVSLKPISPYLQRADELRAQEPVIAYWCTYYAAQVGIGLKAKDPAARDFLFELLGNLEKLKEQIGPTDAIDIESVSAAYVENFALRVFAMADNEDRSGAGNRSTAKKFLAAANFLEVLTTFPKAEVSESTEEKIKYAKWKAADIAKAYREGRKPTPGPAGSDADIDAELLQLQKVTGPSSVESTLKGSSPPAPLSETPVNGKRASLHMEPDVIADANRPFASQTPPRSTDINLELNPGSWKGQHAGEATPGSWSTAATPGTGGTTPQDFPAPESPSANKGKGRERTGSGSSDDHISLQPQVDDGSKKAVHFTPSVAGSTSHGSTPPVSPQHPMYPSNLPPGFVPAPDISLHPSAPPHYPSLAPALTPSAPPPPPPPTRVELTPMVVAKAQKHCRFAISALDYEDAEQARKELRAALAVLGG